MPASGFDLYNMQDARNNFDVMRPTPICTDANQFMGQCQNIHISTNCYYGYHEPKRPQNIEATPDCEMVEAPRDDAYSPPHNHGRKRSADGGNHHQIKRPRPEMQKEKSNEPETNENMKMDRTKEELLETLYWNIHGGNFIDLLQCL
ncbi:uncharacterized protein LOC133516872 isoform X1 [Cydia pomonella]|uniref:uncharacterized protein LOC133516872 isoform X1 n=1 Tax=Cydia pomonella TaxID=82600 RepID=UPI002ADE5F1B|nr:uncharacterized protein LOC133516872 isoform X1 [Cydia pomonella]